MTGGGYVVLRRAGFRELGSGVSRHTRPFAPAYRDSGPAWVDFGPALGRLRSFVALQAVHEQSEGAGTRRNLLVRHLSTASACSAVSHHVSPLVELECRNGT